MCQQQAIFFFFLRPLVLVQADIICCDITWRTKKEEKNSLLIALRPKTSNTLKYARKSEWMCYLTLTCNREQIGSQEKKA